MHSSQRVGLKRNFETETTNLFSEFSGRETEVAPMSSAPNPNYSLRSRSLAENLQSVPSPAWSRCVHISPFVVSCHLEAAAVCHTLSRGAEEQRTAKCFSATWTDFVNNQKMWLFWKAFFLCVAVSWGCLTLLWVGASHLWLFKRASEGHIRCMEAERSRLDVYPSTFQCFSFTQNILYCARILYNI